MKPAPPSGAPAPALTSVAIPQTVPEDIGCVLAHDIVSHTIRGGIDYMYFGRVDIDPLGSGLQKLKIVLQVAMPLDGFLNSFFMLEASIKKMQMEGVVTKEMVNAARARYAIKDEGGI